MNIFATDPCPIKSAQTLDDKRVVKMCLETAQILSSAMHRYGLKTTYRPTHMNHPVVLWAGNSAENYLWTFEHLLALLEEYQLRYGKEHKCAELLEELFEGAMHLPSRGFEPHRNCARNTAKGIDYGELEDVYEAYKLYLSDRWDTDTRPPTWHGR